MIGVELPSYSIYLGIMIGAVSIASVSLLLRTFSRWGLYSLKKPKEDLMAGTYRKPLLWASRPLLKEDSDLCGFIRPEEWECNCGQRKCKTFENLCEAVRALADFGKHLKGTDATPSVQPLPDRKAAIAHTKGKS